jgi:hypothetical protein
MTKETTYSEALQYMRNEDKKTGNEFSVGFAWSVVVSVFHLLPDGVRQALINRLIGIQKEERYKADEKRAEWREKYGEDE